MLKPQLALVCALIITVSAMSGCTEMFSKKTYTFTEDLTIVLSTNYTGNYSVWVPILKDPSSTVLSGAYKSMKVHFDSNPCGPDDGKAHLAYVAQLKQTDKGYMYSLGTCSNVTLTGHAKLTTSLENTESYLQYNWSPIVDAINSTIFMQAKATPTLVNTTLHMDLDWTGKSDYCSRHNTIKGDIRLDGNWTSVGGYFQSSACT